MKSLSCSYDVDPDLSRSAARKEKFEQVQDGLDRMLRLFQFLRTGSEAQAAEALHCIRSTDNPYTVLSMVQAKQSIGSFGQAATPKNKVHRVFAKPEFAVTNQRAPPTMGAVTSGEDAYRAFLTKVYVSYPFLDHNCLQGSFERFIQATEYENKGVVGSHLADTALRGGTSEKQRPMPTSKGDGNDDETATLQRPPLSSLKEAILFLTLAIGTLCMEECSVGDWTSFSLSDPAVDFDGAHTEGSGRYSYIRQTPMDMNTQESQKDSTEYYERATMILGHHVDKDSLPVAQASLLAGLYKHLLRLHVEARNWYLIAGRASCNLIRQQNLSYKPSDNSSDSTENVAIRRVLASSPTHNTILLVAWSVFQLETAVPANLHVFTSGVGLCIEDIAWPSCIPGFESFRSWRLRERIDVSSPTNYDVLCAYTARLWLRRRQRLIWEQLYGECYLKMTYGQIAASLNEHTSTLQIWRQSLPSCLDWTENEKSAPGILRAQVQFAYYNVLYLATRPFLEYLLLFPAGNVSMSEVRPFLNGLPPLSRERRSIVTMETIHRMPARHRTFEAQHCVSATVQCISTLERLDRPCILARMETMIEE